jgi:hypothetical protein
LAQQKKKDAPSGLIARTKSLNSFKTYVFLAVFCALGGYVIYAGIHASSSEIASGRQGYCLDDNADKTANGSKVDIWSCNGSAAQHWVINGSNVEINGKCLDDYGYGTANGNRVDLYACNGGSNQHWMLKGSGVNTELVNVHAGKCLDDTAWGGNGTSLDIYTCTGAKNQIWYASYYGSSSGGGSGSQSVSAAMADAHSILASYGWDNPTQFGCLDNIYNNESSWIWDATNPTSGAYGIPQSLPGGKMAAAGSDWVTNPNTQIKWGVGYIKATYGTPCQAWAFWQVYHAY